MLGAGLGNSEVPSLNPDAWQTCFPPQVSMATRGDWSDDNPAPLNNGQRPKHGTWNFRGQSYYAQSSSRAAESKQVRNSTAPAPQRSDCTPGWRGWTSAPKEGAQRHPSQAVGTGWGRLQLLPPSFSDCLPSTGPPNSYKTVLTPSLSESDLMWKQGL